MSIRRVVPDIHARDVAESRGFYTDVFGFDVAMDMGWIVTLASPDNPTAQISFTAGDASSDVAPNLTIEVGDVHAVYELAVARRARIVRELRDEPWGVRRFFLADPTGVVVNVMAHIASAAGDVGSRSADHGRPTRVKKADFSAS